MNQNELAVLAESLDDNDLILRTEDKSYDWIKRIRIIFKNTLQLSIVKGDGTYGADKGLFEIAIINSKGQWMSELFDECDGGDNICGHLDHLRLAHYINKIGTHKVEPEDKSIDENGRCEKLNAFAPLAVLEEYKPTAAILEQQEKAKVLVTEKWGEKSC